MRTLTLILQVETNLAVSRALRTRWAKTLSSGKSQTVLQALGASFDLQLLLYWFLWPVNANKIQCWSPALTACNNFETFEPMATIFQVFDFTEAARSKVKSQAPERKCLDGGFEAPRNSLDVPFETAGDSRSSIFKSDDIPFGYEYYSPALAASTRRLKKGGLSHSVSHGNSPTRRCESRKRAPNVVARLMGLEALPDELPTRKFSQPGTPTCGSPKPGKSGLTRQRSQGAVPSSWQRPPLPRRAPAEERIRAPVLTFRDHPQEEQLQNFKKEFEAKQQAALAKKQEQLRNLQLEDMNRELEEKKEKVRATLVKAKSALSRAEPKPRLNGEGQFEESKEFLDAMKFLQSNKDFIFQFLQPKPEVACGNEDSNTTTQVTHLKKRKGDASSPSSARKRDGFSPRAFARLFMNPRKWNDSKQQPASDIVSQSPQPTTVDRCNGSGSRGASTEEMLDDEKRRTSSSSNSRSESRAHTTPKVQSKQLRDEVPKGGARDVIVKIKERLRQREQCDRTGEEVETKRFPGFLRDSNDIPRKTAINDRRIPNPTSTEYLSTGKRVSLHTEDMDDVRYTSDGEELSTPLVTIVRENARRSSISLPSSPHLSARSQDVTRVIRQRLTANSGTPPAATLREVKKITTLTSEAPGRRMSKQDRGPVLSNTAVEKSLRKSASVNEVVSRSAALKQRVEASGARCLDQSKEPASNLTRCRSIPNVALLRKRGQCSTDAVQTISGVHQFEKFVSTAKTPQEKPKHMLGPEDEKTKGFISGGRMKARDGSEAMPSAQHLLFPSSTPVLASFVALAESCVSHSKTLSDADNSMDVKLHVRSSRNPGAPKGKGNFRAQILPSKIETYAQFDKCLREPSTEDAESVVSESSADSDAGSCEEELSKALSQLPSLANSTKSESLMAGEALPSTLPRVQQQVQNFKSPQPPRLWSTETRDIPMKQDDEQDSNSDNNGQPSPVSVLEAPFEEESPCLEFKETANSLQGLRIPLRHLKVERIKEDSEHVPDTTRHQLLNSSVKNQTLPTFPQHKTNPLRRFATTHSRNLPYSAGHEADLAFVSNVLISSDFITHGGRLISKWHSAMQPISPHFFQKIETSSSSSDKKGSANRRILFDSINEILAEKLRPLCYRPWTSHSNATVVRTGRRLVEEIWNKIHKRQFPAWCRHDLHGDYLESLVAQDLHTATWMSLHHDVNRICLQMETAIFDDLITDLLLVV